MHAKFYPVLSGGVQTVLDLRFLHFVAPLPEINDRSLIEFLHSFFFFFLIIYLTSLWIYSVLPVVSKRL